MSSDPIYPQGLDCVWLATDHAGAVAAFVTGCCAPIARAALEAHHPAIEDVEELVHRQPVSTSVHLGDHLARHTEDRFAHLAQRGLHVFAWKPAGAGRYERVATPVVPASAEALPANLRALARACAIGGRLFDHRQHLDVRPLLPCVEPQ